MTLSFAGPVMSLLNAVQWPYAFACLVVGSLVGLTGVGGGSLMTPLLVMLFGINPATAVGTDLLFACLTKLLGMTLHAKRGSVDWRIVGRLALGSVPATALAIVLVGRHGAAGRTITTTLGIALMLTAVGIVFRGSIVATLAPRLEALGERGRLVLTVGLGAVLGILVAVSSVGAGAIGVTVLLVLYPRLPTVRIIGSDIGHAVPLALVAGAGHWLYGSVDLRLLGSLLIGSLPGIAATSLLAAKVPERVLRPVLATTLAVVGLRLAA